MNKNIIIAPCGNSSTVFKDHWLNNTETKNFDVCLLFYHERINSPELYACAEYFFHLKDFKYRMIHQLLTAVKPELLEQYDQFYFLDDDIEIGTNQINKMFDLTKGLGLLVSQASLTHDSYSSWPILKHKPDCFLRFIGQAEVMAPLFCNAALKICLPSFTDNKSSWGIDSVWSTLLGYPTDKIAVIDAVQMKHINPVGVGELYSKINADPRNEWDIVVEKYGAIKNNFTEHGRFLIVKENKNRLLKFIYIIDERLARFKQSYLDLGLSYRIKDKVKFSSQMLNLFIHKLKNNS